MDYIEIWMGTLIYYLEKFAPYMIAGVIINIIIKLIGD